jgi:NAD(P)-dependent dehydrogenase (short-subunit alcohol dehydrogenase family)
MTNVVIGAASGMGAATARKIAHRGRLIVADYNLEGAQKIAAEIGGDIKAMACDISNQDQIDALMAEVGDNLEALVVTAGVSGSQAPGRRIIEVNLMGVERVVRAAEPKVRPGTVAVLVASQSGYMVPNVPELFEIIDDPLAPGMLDRLAQMIDVDVSSLCYQLSKRSVHRMARRHAKTWGLRGGRILSLSPGISDTPMGNEEIGNNPVMLKMIEACPMGRPGTPEDIANAMDFLTSPAASYMTGSDVLVDGGMSNVLPTNTWDGKIKIPQKNKIPARF